MTPRERADAEARALFVIEQHKDLGDVWWTVSRESTLVASAMSDAGAAARRDEHAAPIADAIERAIESALAEQAAGEAERVREAVARVWREASDYANARGYGSLAAKLRARATSPEPEPCVAPGHPRCSASAPCSWCRDAGASPAPAPLAAERAVVEAAERLMTPPSAAGVATVLGPRLHGAILDLQAARAAERKGGG